MAEVKKQNYRLFKVAKEFNVSIDTIVEHLHHKGHDVANSPNTKLPGDLYNVLLKEFASEKQLKEKAEQIIEKRKEETRVSIRTRESGEQEEESGSHVSAEQLRHSIRGSRRRRRKPAEKSPEEIINIKKEVSPPPVVDKVVPPTPKEETPKKESPKDIPAEQPAAEITPELPIVQPESKEETISVEKAETVETPITKEKVKDIQPEKEAEKVEPPDKTEEKSTSETSEDQDQPKLKILGKIDLNTFPKRKRTRRSDRSRRKRQTTSSESPRDKRTEGESLKKPVRDKNSASPKKKTREVPSLTNKDRSTTKETTSPEKQAKTNTPPKSIKSPADQPKVETKEKPVIETPQLKTTPPQEEEQPESVMRAGDRTPNLRGLKVMGKIELPSDKAKKKKEKEKEDKRRDRQAGDKKKEKGASTTQKEGTKTDGESDDNKKRRRRRRKRKRKPAVAENSQNQNAKKTASGGGGNNNNSGRKKKEKVTKKEVDASIKQTYSQMNRAPSRHRQRLRRQKRDSDAKRRDEERILQEKEAKVLQLTEFITANEFANLIDVPVNGIITKSFELGMMVSINQRLDAELLSILAEEYGYKAEFIDVTDKEFEEEEEEEAPENLKERSPIITVMGHVDHGKTTLLDHLRNSNVTSQEAGGITQHIGAYEITLESGRHVTLLDTPGHEAFTAMRARGAKVTDVVIVVVAADDAVMPQTKEAINHAQAAGVPMVFAINKIDKDGADPERIKGQLAEMNLLVEDWGGTFQSQEISALKGVNVDELLEKVILESDLLELKANPDRHSSGTVIEARLDKGRGNVATMLVQNGTLKVGDEMVAGIHYGKVRALINQNGDRIKSAGPSIPVQVLGLSGQPQAGDKFQIFIEDGKAKSIAQKRSELFREQQFRQTKHITLEEITRRRAIGNFKELNIIIRGDVDGSVEALSGSLLKLSTDEVQVNILLKGVGAITESDVTLASASDAVIIAFNVRPNAPARGLADREGIEMRTYSVIYDAINDVKDALEGLLSPEIKEEMLGTAEVREVFKITKVGAVAGCYATSGKLYRDEQVRVIRDGVVIYNSKFSSLKRYKENVKEVINGSEFGAMVENYNDIKVGDVFECFRTREIRRKL